MKKELGDKVVYIQRKNMLSSRDDRKIGFTDTSFELYEKMNKTKEWYYENNISYVKDLEYNAETYILSYCHCCKSFFIILIISCTVGNKG